jgi:hypothetical protein
MVERTVYFLPINRVKCCVPGDWPILQEVSIPEWLGKMVVEGRFLIHNLQVEPSRADKR